MDTRTHESPRAISPAHAAHVLGCSRTTIDNMIDDEVLTAVRYGRRVFVTESSISDFLNGGGQ